MITPTPKCNLEGSSLKHLQMFHVAAWAQNNHHHPQKKTVSIRVPGNDTYTGIGASFSGWVEKMTMTHQSCTLLVIGYHAWLYHMETGFCITGPLWRGSTDQWLIPLTKGLWYGPLIFSFDVSLNKLLCKCSGGWWFEMPLSSGNIHCNGLIVWWQDYTVLFSYISGCFIYHNVSHCNNYIFMIFIIVHLINVLQPFGVL